MNYFFHPEAEKELNDSIAYYESCACGLGYDFSIEVHSTIKQICSIPRAWPVLFGEIRRCQTNRFPYGLLYIEEEVSIYIIAVMHLRRDPDYWQERIRQSLP